MVLEEASHEAPTPDFASESTPQSDLDPYASSNNPSYTPSHPTTYIRVNTASNPPLYINAANLPKPLLYANWYALYARILPQAIQREADLIQRPVTQEEADALASHIATSVRIGSWGTPLGLVLGGLQFARGLRRFRFPLYTPFKTGSRLSPDRFGPLRGARARAAWHGARFVAYGFVGVSLARLGCASYAFSTYIANRARDPRLGDVVELSRQGLKERQRLRGEGVREGRRGVEEGERAALKGESVEMSRMRRRAEGEEARKRQAGRDDMSPTGGAFEAEQGVQAESGFAQDDWSAPRDGMEGQSWQADGTSSDALARPQMSSTTPTSTPPKPPRQTSASTQQAPPTNKQSSSAWDRLRQNAMSGSQSTSASNSPTSNSPPSNSPTSDSDSFSFSQRDEEKQLANSEAQKEFDARVEKERDGRDFDDGSGSKRGGGRW